MRIRSSVGLKLACLLVIIVLTACGQRGPLYLPQNPSSTRDIS